MNPLSLLKCVQYVCKLHVVFDKDTSLEHFDRQCTYCIGWGPQQPVLHNIWSLFFLRIYAILLALLLHRIYCIKDIIKLLYIMVRNASVHFFDWYHVSLATESKKDKKWMVQPVLNLLRFKKSLHEEMKVTNVKVMHDVKGESKIHSHHSHGKIQAKGSSERLNQSFEVLLLLYFFVVQCILVKGNAFWSKVVHSRTRPSLHT